MPHDDFGPCCCCGGTTRVRNVVMLSLRAPVPGKGWGCVQCGLPPDGAVYVACDDCVRDRREPAEVCVGWVKEGKRIPVAELARVEFDHDYTRHPGEL